MRDEERNRLFAAKAGSNCVRGQWADDAKTPQVKIFYDVTEAEITVLGKWKGETKTETLLVDDNLDEVLQQAKKLVKEWYGDGSE